jgi:hypothetical protein
MMYPTRRGDVDASDELGSTEEHEDMISTRSIVFFAARIPSLRVQGFRASGLYSCSNFAKTVAVLGGILQKGRCFGRQREGEHSQSVEQQRSDAPLPVSLARKE